MNKEKNYLKVAMFSSKERSYVVLSRTMVERLFPDVYAHGRIRLETTAGIVGNKTKNGFILGYGIHSVMV